MFLINLASTFNFMILTNTTGMSHLKVCLAVCIDGARDDGWGSPETFDVERLE